MAKQDTLAAISDETKEMLEDHVKKGKARKFFLICKGATINTLEVFKKGPFGPRIMKAKKDGFKGEVTYGVVTGQGKELYFQLAGNQAVAEIMKVDSFCDKPPTKRAKLREFLVDNDLTFKCTYYIISDTSLAPDPDSESGASGPPPASCKATVDGDTDASLEGETDETESEETSTAPVSETNLFTERLKTLKPEIDRVVALGQPLSSEVKLRVSEAALFARKKEFDQANGLLDQVEKLLKQSASTQPSAPTADLSGLFNKRFAELIARVKLVAGSEWDQDLKLKASEAGMFARKKDFEQANEALDAVESLLNDIEDSLKQPGATNGQASVPTGTVSFAKARLDWQAAKKNVEGQLSRLRAAILEDFDDEEALSGAEKLELVLARFNEGLSDSLDDLYSAEASKKPGLAQAALKTVGNYVDYVESDELISHIEANPYEALTIRSALLNSLTEIQSQLRSIA